MIRSRSNPGFTICNHERCWHGPMRRYVPWWPLLIVAFCLQAPARGWCADPAWRVLIEPKFMKHEVSHPIAGSTRAVLVPALLKEDGPACMSQTEFDALGVDWKTFLEAARANASDELKKLTPAYTRDRKKVIEFATLTSDSPLVASTILSPDFLKLFADTLGPKVIVVVPDRYTVYVFPVLASRYQEYLSMVSDTYRATSYPVSMEAYELSDQGLKTVGVYQEP